MNKNLNQTNQISNLKRLTATALVIACCLIFAPASASAAKVSSSIPWGKVVYNGYGKVSWNNLSKTLYMAPKASTEQSETHAALVVSNQTLKQPYQVSFTMNTIKQLRTGSAPNPWEVGWFGFGYKPDGKFKYVILKPNGYGVEIGESLLNDQQNFSYTSPLNQDIFNLNTKYNVVVKVQDNVITLTVNGKPYVAYTMSAKDTLTADGQYAFYTEDAEATFSNILATQL
ncbi:MAG: hypothetical protein Q7K39_04105 [Candidatus Magasanikbacteria bacterium]|nr:hypothetical protein [Candidatus Magasanikbacteria bacterium]